MFCILGLIYRKIPLIRPPLYKPPEYTPPPNMQPSLSDLRNIKFTKNVSLPQVFSCILLAQFIYLVSPQVETLSKLIPAGTKCQNNKQRQPTIETL